MVFQLMTDGAVSVSHETRYFSGTIPSEILLSIIERCDVPTLVRCLSLNRSTKQLISLFSHQIVDSIASRQYYYHHPIFTRDKPDKLTVAYLLQTHLAHQLCMNIFVSHFGKDSDNMSLGENSPEKRKQMATFQYTIHVGCSVALRLIHARRAGENLFADEERAHSKTFNRQLTTHWRLEKHIELAQMKVLRNTRAMDLLSFKLFWMARAMGITPPGRFTAVQEYSPSQHRRPDRTVQRKRFHNPRDTTWNIWMKRWAAGYLLDRVGPVTVLKAFGSQSHLPHRKELFEKFLDPIYEGYCTMSCEARLAHLERAQRVLDTIDKAISNTFSIAWARQMNASQNQQQRLHNLRVLADVRQIFKFTRLPGQSIIPPMSSQPFAETIEAEGA